MKVKEYNEIKKFSEASGTAAIVEENITMKLNKYGLYEESIHLSPEKKISSLIEYVSPNFNTHINEDDIGRKLYKNIDNIQHDNRIGYYLSCYAGYVAEGEYRKNASSGGMGTWIFKELFKQDLIDGVIHVKENKDSKSSVMFKYDISRTVEEIKEGAKTKYYPVEVSEVLNIVKKIPGRYAVIGIPSFIMAIRLLAEKDSLINERIKYTIGLICGHQKSSKFAESIAWQVGIKPGDLKHIDFRKKLLDKPANNYGVKIIGLIGGEERTIIKPTKELLGQNWGHGFFKSLASDFTDDVLNETADITLGDAWLPEYTKDSKGNNVVIARNSDIQSLISDGIKNGKLNFDVVDKEVILRSQNAHYRHTYEELPYRLYKKDSEKEWRPKKRVKASKNIPFLRKKVQDLRKEISTRSHIIYEEAVEREDLNYFIDEMSKMTRKYSFVYKFLSLDSKFTRIKELGLQGTLRKVLHKFKIK